MTLFLLHILPMRFSSWMSCSNNGLLTMSPEGVFVKPAGRLLIRNACMLFDRYSAKKTARFSTVI